MNLIHICVRKRQYIFRLKENSFKEEQAGLFPRARPEGNAKRRSSTATFCGASGKNSRLSWNFFAVWAAGALQRL
jgi:hypothetical protein